MKKFLITVFLVLFATSVYAEVNFSLTGSFHGRGQYWSHEAFTDSAVNYGYGCPIPDGQASDTVKWSVYDGDLNLYPKITAGNTTLNMKIALKDETWDDPGGDRTVADVDEETPIIYDQDDNIKIERLYMQHNFDNGVQLHVGLMDGGAWGTVFADNVTQKYRVKIMHTKTPVGVIGGLVEKNTESSDPYVKDSEKDDDDSYALFMVTKAGDIFIKPLLFYVDNSSKINDLDSDGIKVLYFALELSGDLGDGLGFESELGWKQYTWEDYKDYGAVNANDGNLYGAYFNVWKSLDAAKVGLILTYGNWDDESGATGAGQGWDYGDDFESNLILGDWVAWGDTPGDPSPLGAADANAQGHDLTGMSMIKLYAGDIKTPVDKLTAKASFSYIVSNQEDSAIYQATYGMSNIYEDATAMELDLGAAYSITDNLTYSADFGYAILNYDVTGLDDPDPVMLLQHKIAFSF